MARELPLEFCNSDMYTLKKKPRVMPVPDGGWKEFDDICICFDTIPECDGQTDRETDGRICHNNIALCMHIGMLTRDKNDLD